MRQIKRRRSDISPKINKMADSVRRSKRGSTQHQKREKVEFLTSGCTTFNLALSGKGKDGGWARARVDNIVGDGSSGKTVCALELCFNAWKQMRKIKSQVFPPVTKLTIVYNNCEGVMDFPLEVMYGADFVKAVEWVNIKVIEEMGRDYMRRLDELEKGEALIYVIDSWDALYSIADKKRFDEAVEKGKEESGSYNLEKQKYAGKFFSHTCDKMENNEKDATLFIISQVRVKIGATFGKKTYRAGGKALDFYTHQVAWIREQEKLAKTKRGHKRVYGIRSEAKIERSKVAKPFRESRFTILYDYGIDDVNSMADFLWGTKTIRFDGQIFKTRPSFVAYIEDNNLEDALIEETTRVWYEIEAEFEKEVAGRKARF